MPFTEGYFYGKMSTNVPWREERLLVRSCILMGGPRREGNTAALLAPFLEECEALGVETKTVWLYDEDIAPCRGCMGCQDRLDGQIRPVRITSRAMWSSDEPPQYTGAIGKVAECEEEEGAS